MSHEIRTPMNAIVGIADLLAKTQLSPVPFEICAGTPVRQAVPGETIPEPPLPILLAEDSPDNCTIIMAYLEDTPYQVEIAETGPSPVQSSRAECTTWS